MAPSILLKRSPCALQNVAQCSPVRPMFCSCFPSRLSRMRICLDKLKVDLDRWSTTKRENSQCTCNVASCPRPPVFKAKARTGMEFAQADLKGRTWISRQEQFPHNANLQQQFASLAASFQAWRPIRGDGCSAERCWRNLEGKESGNWLSAIRVKVHSLCSGPATVATGNSLLHRSGWQAIPPSNPRSECCLSQRAL